MVEDSELIDRAKEVAKLWSSWGPHTKEATKHLLDVQTNQDFETHLKHERTLIEAAGTTDAFKEGVAAFWKSDSPILTKNPAFQFPLLGRLTSHRFPCRSFFQADFLRLIFPIAGVVHSIIVKGIL